jgi:hypothetical protein
VLEPSASVETFCEEKNQLVGVGAGKVIFWNASTGEVARTLDSPEFNLFPGGIAKSSKHAFAKASGLAPHQCDIWDLQNNKILWELGRKPWIAR